MVDYNTISNINVIIKFRTVLTGRSGEHNGRFRKDQTTTIGTDQK